MSNFIRAPYIRQYLLEPLEQLFTPISDAKRTLYLDAMRNWTDNELRETFMVIRDSFTTHRFPSIAELQRAKRGLASGHPTRSAAAVMKMPWEEREQQRADAIGKFMKEFICSPVYFRASEEGWGYELTHYARAVAEVQAQLIFPAPCGVNYDALAVYGPFTHSTRKQEFLTANPMSTWWRWQSEQAAKGTIHLEVRNDFMEEWRARAAARRSPLYTQPPEPDDTTAIRANMERFKATVGKVVANSQSITHTDQPIETQEQNTPPPLYAGVESEGAVF